MSGDDAAKLDDTQSGSGPAGDHSLEPDSAFGRYTIRDRLGGGGMGEVYAVHDPRLDRVVALKVMRPGLAGESPEARARFSREAQAMARLNHPNVVSVFDAGTVGDRVYVTMELVAGPTLATWLAGEPRSQRAIVDVFLQAGRGLAAAHAAGIVHRDFKPSNVIVGDRVRVCDFGLARVVTDQDAGVPITPASFMLEAVVTRTGAVVGTPAYLAPEQRDGAPASPLSDQYSFALSLRESLSGARPGGASTPRPIPRRLRRIVERALSVRPEERYPSMDRLLADLGRRPGRARWAALAAAAAIAATWLVPRALEESPCRGAEAAIADAWDGGDQARVAAAFTATGLASASEDYGNVDRALRRRQADWVRAHREACEATHVRHEQSAALLDRRMRCLARARTEIEELVARLGSADRTAVDRAPQAAAQAGGLERCADPSAVEPPRDAATRVLVEAQQRDLARLAAMRNLSSWKDAQALAHELVQRARRIAYPPVVAETLGAAGHTEIQTEGDLDLANALLFEAAQVGAAVGDDALMADALAASVAALARLRRFDAAEVAFQAAKAATARAGNSSRQLADLYEYRAVTLYFKGDLAAALPLRFLALSLYQRVPDVEPAKPIVELAGIASILTVMGQVRLALVYHDRAIAAAEAAGGRRQLLALLLQNAGSARLATDLEGAAARIERGLALTEANVGADTPNAAFAMDLLSQARTRQRRLPEARALAERALKIRETRTGDSLDTARSLVGLGTVLRLQGDAARAHELCQRAAAIQRKVRGEEALELISTGLEDALALGQLGRLPEARVTAEQSLALALKLIGESHETTASLQALLGDILCTSGRCAEALPLLGRAVVARDRGAASESLADAFSLLCGARLAVGDAAGARAAAARAVAIAIGAPPETGALAQLCLAKAEWKTPADRPAALARARDARARLAALPYGASDLAQADRWLADKR